MYVTDADIQGFLNIEGMASKYLTASQDADVLTSVKANADAVLIGHMSEKHRRIQRTISGLRLTTSAFEGQTDFTIPLMARNVDADNSHVWVNLCGAYRDRDANDSVTFTVSVDNTTLILDEGLNEGDTVVCDLVYSGENRPQILKKLALDLAIQDLITRKPALCNDPLMRETFRENYQAAMMMLTKMKAGRLLIDEWEELDLIPENRAVTPEGPGILYVGW